MVTICVCVTVLVCTAVEVWRAVLVATPLPDCVPVVAGLVEAPVCAGVVAWATAVPGLP